MVLFILIFCGFCACAQDKLEMPVQQIDSLKALKEFSYANDPAYWPKKVEDNSEQQLDWLESFLKSGWLKLFFYVLLIIFLGFILYRILSERNLLLFTKKSKARKKTVVISAGDQEPDLDQLLNAAESMKDYHESVRLQYLKTLLLLKTKGLLEYHPEWTNARYLQQFRKHQKFEQFRQLSRIYEYVCYGGFPADAAKYQVIKQEFSNFQQTV
jgi:hypothetical protein